MGRRTAPGFEVLVDAGDGPDQLTDFFRGLYGGGLGFAAPRLYANFVESVDGVVSLGDVPSAGSVISGRNPSDRLLMGILRALADAVLVGAGTLRATPGHAWTAEHVFPDLAGPFASLRAGLGKTARPRLFVLTGSGDVDLQHPGLRGGATILTTTAAAARLGAAAPADVEILAVADDDRVPVGAAVAAIHDSGHGVVLSEAGPTVLGQLLDGDLVDDVFVTLSPLVAGRLPASARKGLVDGIEFLPDRRLALRLASLRRRGDHVFLRYSGT